MGWSELTGLSHEDDVVGPRVEGSVEVQSEHEGLATAHDKPLQAHLLRVMLLVILVALQVNGCELQGCHWGRDGDRSLPSCSSLGSAANHFCAPGSDLGKIPGQVLVLLPPSFMIVS